MLRSIRIAFILVALFSFCYVVSQGKFWEKEDLIASYRDAITFYNKATALSNSAHYSEAEERKLNAEALKRLTLLLSKFPAGRVPDDTLFFKTCFTIGELEHYFERLDKALSYYQKAMDAAARMHLPDSFLFKPLLYAGIIYYNQNSFDSAYRVFTKADHVQQQYGVPLQESERLYNTLGVLSYETGNYRQAKRFFQKALKVLSTANPYYRDLLVNYKINLAQMHLNLEEYEEANTVYQELLPLKVNTHEIHHNLGLINLKLGAAEKALDYFQKVGFEEGRKIYLYTNMANAYLLKKRVDSAGVYLAKAMAVWEKTKADPFGYGLTLKTAGDLALANDSAFKAMQYYAQAMHRFYPAYNKPSVYSNPEQFSGVFAYINLFATLTAKAEAAHRLYQTTKELSWAAQELNAYQAAFRLIEYVMQTYNSDEARLFITRFKYGVQAKPINIAYELYEKTGDRNYLEALYSIDQQNKASVLVLNQQLADQRREATEEHQKENKIKTNIVRLSLQASQTGDSVKIAEINRQILDQEILLARLNQSAYQTERRINIPSLSFLQGNLLDKETAIVSYHLSADRLISTIITKDSINCIRQMLPPHFHQQLESFIKSSRTPDSLVEKKVSQMLYSVLLKGVESFPVKRLLLIPQNELNYLPFESLQDKDGTFLIQKFSVQYHYSTALLKKEKFSFSYKNVLAFAPFTEMGMGETFRSLPYSKEELSFISEKGKVLEGEKATKEAFIRQGNKYKIVHLATHAKAGEGTGKSYVAFQNAGRKNDSFLYEEEIYSLRLKGTELIVLSACEAGAGDLIRGEGVMSLSRAFTYAGCPNIITTLWKADDFSTAYIIKKMYAYLDKDYTIDKALQQAQIDYAEDPGINPRLKHPYYWAHLVYVGNLQTAGSFLPYLYGVGAFLLVLLFFFLYKKCRKPVAAKETISGAV